MKNYSQNNEQETILKYLTNKNMINGKLLDIGAYDGETFSNVKQLMNVYKGWRGVFIEPSSHCFVKLYESYKIEPKRAELLNLAVVLEDELDKTSILEFYDSPMSAVSSSVKGWTDRGIGESNKEYNSEGDCINPRKIFVGKVGMREILNKFGPFDLINIDVEGYSANLALQEWFNPLDYGCKLLCIENDNRQQCLLNKFSKLGYEVIGNTPENIIFAITN
jgi:FkbM family methyltransferase